MEEVLDFILGIFDSSKWPARWRCGQWTDFHGWLYVLSDFVIFLSYFAIPVLILRVILKKKVPFLTIFWLFVGFILLCGLSHLIDAIIFWYPYYKLSALIRFATAIVSVTTVIALIRILPKVFDLKSPDLLQAEVDQRKLVEEKLRTKVHELSRTNHELDRFVYSAAHDLRAPMTSVLGLIDIAADESKEEHTKEYLTMMRESIEGLDRFIKDIVHYSKNNRLEVQQEAINFKTLVNDVFDQIKYLDNSQGIKLSTNIECEQFTSDRHRLFIVLKNLIENAIKYSPQDHIVIDIKSKLLPTGDIEIQVCDEGLGIEESQLGKIFDMYYRASKEREGSGLGLYIVKEIAHKLGGNILVDSTLGKGSCFKLTIPNLNTTT